jgi:hypothetical protein
MLPKTEASWQTVLMLILSWYTTSISLHLYNKWLFSNTHNNFNFPLFTTMIHMIIQGGMSFIVLKYLFPSLKPARLPSRADYLYRVVPCGIATALDIGLSNSSMKVFKCSPSTLRYHFIQWSNQQHQYSCYFSHFYLVLKRFLSTSHCQLF